MKVGGGAAGIQLSHNNPALAVNHPNQILLKQKKKSKETDK